MFYRSLLACLLLAVFCLPVYSRDNAALAGLHKSGTVFIENKGQVTDQYGTARSDIDFKITAASGLNIFIGKGRLHYQWVKTQAAQKRSLVAGSDRSPAAGPVEMYRMDVTLLGCNKNAIVTANEPDRYSERYYTASVGSGGTIAHTFATITYHDIYPNIDWVFYFNAEGKLEHDFIIHPGGNASDIKLQYGGATNLILNSDGSLTAETPFGMVKERAPYAYRKEDKSKVASMFVLNDNILSFSTAASKGTVVIDPSLEWGTYFGGNDVDMIYDVVAAKDNCAYVTGGTSSTANIATTGAYQFIYNGGTGYMNDAFIAKFNSAGNCLWSTYYGGSGEDEAKSISSDTSGKLYIAGFTYSATGLATIGAHQLTSGGSYDVFIAKFDTSGQRVWGTYFGGANEDGWGPVALHCDMSNHIYLTGQTNSSNGIATTGASQDALFGGILDQDGFLAKFQTDGTFIWGTYFGGNFSDAAYAITNDTAGNIYITGNTNSTVGISTTGQTANGGGYDAFAAKFDPSGNKAWSTYLGGNLDDYGMSIACDDSSNIYIGGQTLSTSGLATTGAYQGVYGGGYIDGFLTKLSPSANPLFSTYYGGSSEDAVSRVYCATNGDIYITGLSGSTGMSTSNGPQPNLGGYYDGFVSRFGTDGNLVWGSYLGGFDYDEADAVFGDALGNLYIIGYTMSATGIATNGAWQSSFGGGDYDGFLMRIKDCTAPLAPDTIIGQVNVCAGSLSSYTSSTANATSYNWILPPGWSGNSSTSSIAITFGGNAGVLKVTAENYCAASDTTYLSVTVNALPLVPEITQADNILSVPATYSSYQWLKDGDFIPGAVTATYTPVATGSYAVIVFNSFGCSDTTDVFNYATSVPDILKISGINVFPNPATNIVYINSMQTAYVALYSTEGRLLKSKELYKGISEMPIDDLSNGEYAMRFTDSKGGSIGTQQLIISGQ